MKAFETKNLCVRRFIPEDWKDLKEISELQASSEFVYADHQWPLDEQGCRDMAEYCSGNDNFMAVELKESHKVICLVALNGIDNEKVLDIGHVVNLNYLNKGYEFEVLEQIYDMAFKDFDIEGIKATWALADQTKLKPLKRLGMEVRNTFTAPKFTVGSDGSTGEFEGCTLYLFRNDWALRI